MNLSVTSTNQSPPIAPASARSLRDEFLNLKLPGRLFSLRGGLLLTLGLFLVFGPAPQDFDIIASILGFSLLTILWLIAMFNVVYGNSLLRNLSVDLLGSEAILDQVDSTLRSNEPLRFTLRTSKVRIPTFFVLKLSLEFESEVIPTSVHQLTGSRMARRVVQDQIVFPHRGNWMLSGISLRFVDQFGFAHQRTKNSLPASLRSITIKPPLGFTAQLPILSSSHRAGDDVSASSEHQGDPYDLKPYHPSDGIKKILWKVYARTGELVARHPERSMTPEGQVVIYVMAKTSEDYVCSSTLAYVRLLAELDLEIVLGCEGMNERPLGRDIESCEELLVDSAFDSKLSDAQSEIHDISRLTGEVGRIFPGISLDRILIFIGRDRFQTQQDALDIIDLGQQLQSHGITPVFFVAENRQLLKSKPSSTWAPRWLISSERAPARPSPAIYTNFVGICARNNWDVILA
jgi:hypothetical protein